MQNPEPPPQLQRFKVAHPSLGMVVTYTWPEPLLQALRAELSKSLEPAKVLAAFLQNVEVDVTLTVMRMQPGIDLPGAGALG